MREIHLTQDDAKTRGAPVGQANKQGCLLLGQATVALVHNDTEGHHAGFLICC
jgi:hypothetical protein